MSPPHSPPVVPPTDAGADFNAYISKQREIVEANKNTSILQSQVQELLALKETLVFRYQLRQRWTLQKDVEALHALIQKRQGGIEQMQMEARLAPYITAYDALKTHPVANDAAQGGTGTPTTPVAAPVVVHPPPPAEKPSRKRALRPFRGRADASSFRGRADASSDAGSVASLAVGASKKEAKGGAPKAPKKAAVAAAAASRESELRTALTSCTTEATRRAYNQASVHNELRSELDNAAPPVYVVQSDICHKCDTVMIILASDALLGCPKCSYTRLYIQATSSRITYGEEVEFANFSYKRINHFQEWLNTFQAKESTEVPEPIIIAVMEQLFAGKKVRDVAAITQKVVRETLKDLKLRKYYDHTPQITARITAVLPPRMTPFQAEQVKLMFSAIQGPFNIHCPPERTNFLSYGYCLFKFCELMGYDEFLPCFTLLKGQDKLSAMDRIWEKICFELDWQFISSV
jgi:hypothetical protein